MIGCSSISAGDIQKGKEGKEGKGRKGEKGAGHFSVFWKESRKEESLDACMPGLDILRLSRRRLLLADGLGLADPIIR